jgi:HSP20 family protein
MPGFKREEIEITLEQGTLAISAERTNGRQKGGEQNGSQQGQPLLTERRFVRYQRSFSLPTAVDDGNVEARLEDGVLHLTLPKRPEVKPRRIKVN